MQLTKYSHACLVLHTDDQSLVIDPGVFSKDFIVPSNVVGVVITHEHSDHLDREQLLAITRTNPQAVIYAHADLAAHLEDFSTKTVEPDQVVEVGGFTLRFTGGLHALIHGSMPVIANLGVMVNETLYYPGDSFSLPDSTVPILALPVAAPWMKLAEAMDYLHTVKPQRAFPTHDAILSDIGQAMVDNMLNTIAQEVNTSYERIAPGSTIEI